MRKNKLLFLVIIVSSIGINNSFSQNSINSSGNTIISAGNGSISYSVGQVVYTTNFDTSGSVAQGVQQPYEISEVLSSVDFSDLVKDLKIFPNPSTDVLTINMSNLGDTSLDYELIDSNGRVLIQEKNIASETNIQVASLPSAIYFLKIKNQNTDIKTFKIIKK
ncbi:T9SS type A sorting domain-containing protein [Flavobacterium sp. J27]|uniref:T9SS type A sorting domain-containing protein n=1 Tax=Flavobacterium sp. J27 TaxID=2060419 RepID=UPI0010309C9F|nr:T9SS type A sorting domain-containing protein [Flavobacterium sp. J27]